MPTDLNENLPADGTVPADAFALSAPFELIASDEGEDRNRPQPIRMLARTGQPIDHFYWGSVVHDMAGFTTHKPVLAVDYRHGEEIGYLDRFEIDDDHNLIVSGMLTPTDDPSDLARRILQRRKAGVPYEASIYFDPAELSIEEVPAGFQVDVNGFTFEGPGRVIRKWVLRGVAVCPHGYDRETRAEFSDPRGSRKGPPRAHDTAMSKATSEPAGDTPAAEDKTTPADKPEQGGATEPATGSPDQAPAETPERGGGPEDAAPSSDAAAPGAAGELSADRRSAIAEFDRFKEKFGDEGELYFRSDFSLDQCEAIDELVKPLRQENAELKQKLSGLNAADDEGRGEGELVGASPEGGKKKTTLGRIAGKHYDD